MKRRVVRALFALAMCFAMLPATALASGIDSGSIPKGLEISGTVVTGYTGDATGLVIPEGVTEIGESAFYENETLTEVSLPSTLKSIDDWAFYGNTALFSVEFAQPSELAEIGKYAFYECVALESIDLPMSVTNIGEEAFRECGSLESVSMPGVTDIGVRAFYKSALTSATGPLVTTVGEGAFSGCRSLEKVDFPKLEVIGSQAFQLTGLTDFTLPETVTDVGSYFLYATSDTLRTIHISKNVLFSATFDKLAFSGALWQGPTHERTQVILTGVDESVTLLTNGVETGGKSVTIGADDCDDKYEAMFHPTQVETVDGATGIVITNETGEEVTVNGEPVLTGSVKPVGVQNDAYLYTLGIVEGHTTSPTFNNQEFELEAAVDYTVGTVTVRAVPSDERALVMIGGSVANKENDWSVVVTLAQGENKIPVDVTAADNVTTKTYSLTVTQKPKPQDLVISTPEELRSFAEAVNQGAFTGVPESTVTLAADIDLAGTPWTPMGWDEEHYFSGTFDGAGHTISGMSVTSEDEWIYVGLFGFTDGNIKNLTVSGTIDSSQSDANACVGMIVGKCAGGSVTSCVAEGEITGTGAIYNGAPFCVGGVAGHLDRAPARDCTSLVEITLTHCLRVGGVVGQAGNCDVLDSVNKGSITISEPNSATVGGVVACIEGGVVECCHNSCDIKVGKASMNMSNVGGIAGETRASARIVRCENSGDLSGYMRSVGGIIGKNFFSDDAATVVSCLNSGAISNDRMDNFSSAGGIVGLAKCPADGEAISSCISMGTVAGGGSHGSIVGKFNGQSTAESFSNNYRLGSVVSSDDTLDCGSKAISAENITQDLIDQINEAGGCFRLNDDRTIGVCPYTYTLTVDYGYDEKTEVLQYPKATVVHLDAGSRPGYTFAGWEGPDGVAFADASSARTTLTMPAADVSVTATWRAIPYVPDPGHDVEVTEPEHGTVDIDPDRAEEGEEVTVTPTPDEGFEVGDVTVTDEGGEPVEVTGNADGTWSFVMPDGEVTVTVTFRCDGGELCPTNGFTDVDQSAWYHDAVDWAVVSGVLNGYGEGGTSLGPVAPITRAEMAQVLYNQAGRPDADVGLLDFTDVAADGWYADAVAWCLSEGLFQGYGDTFGTERVISREEAAMVLWRAAGTPVSEADLSGFDDAADVSPFAETAMRWAVETGTLTGKGGVALDPQGGCTRGEVAAMLMRLAKGA